MGSSPLWTPVPPVFPLVLPGAQVSFGFPAPLAWFSEAFDREGPRRSFRGLGGLSVLHAREAPFPMEPWAHETLKSLQALEEAAPVPCAWGAAACWPQARAAHAVSAGDAFVELPRRFVSCGIAQSRVHFVFAS